MRQPRLETHNIEATCRSVKSWVDNFLRSNRVVQLDCQVSISRHPEAGDDVINIFITHINSDFSMMIWVALTDQLNFLYGLRPKGVAEGMRPMVQSREGVRVLRIRYFETEVRCLVGSRKPLNTRLNSWTAFSRRHGYSTFKGFALMAEPKQPCFDYFQAYQSLSLDDLQREELTRSPLKIVLATETGPALGNLSLSIKMANALVAQAGWEVVLFVGMSGHTDPGYQIDQRVQYYRSDFGLMMLYPEMRFHTQANNVVTISLCNFLDHAIQQWQLPAISNQQNPIINMPDYQSDISTGRLLGNVKLPIGLSIDDKPSLGIIHPEEVCLESREHIQAALQKLYSVHPNHIYLFGYDKTIPTYFGYVYNPYRHQIISKISGIDVIQTFLMFIGHLRASQQSQAKIYLPIRFDQLQELLINSDNQSLLGEFTFHYSDNQVSQNLGSGKKHVWILNLFPIQHQVFRLLMQDAMLCETPIAVTGDQSLMEAFFAHPVFTLIYQVLAHKEMLFNVLLKLCDQVGANFLSMHLQHLQSIKNSRHSDQWMRIGAQMHEKKLHHQQDSHKLRGIIRAQPDLLDGIKRVVSRCDQQREIVRRQIESGESFWSPKLLEGHAPSRLLDRRMPGDDLSLCP